MQRKKKPKGTVTFAYHEGAMTLMDHETLREGSMVHMNEL